MNLSRRILPRAISAGIVLLATIGCGAPMRWNHLGGEAAAEQGVYEAVIRYVHTFYDAPDWNPSPAAWCVAIGRRASVAARGRDGSDDSLWTPPPRLLTNMSDLTPPVHPIGDCGTVDGEELLLETGQRAIVVALEHPFWESPEFARVLVFTRQDPRAFNRFNCRVARTFEAWAVQECI